MAWLITQPQAFGLLSTSPHGPGRFHPAYDVIVRVPYVDWHDAYSTQQVRNKSSEQGINRHLERDCSTWSAAANTTRGVIADPENRPHDIR